MEKEPDPHKEALGNVRKAVEEFAKHMPRINPPSAEQMAMPTLLETKIPMLQHGRHKLGFIRYYWICTKHFGKRVSETRGAEFMSILALTLVTGLLGALTGERDWMRGLIIGLLSLAGWLSIFALGHLVRSPVVIHRDATAESRAIVQHWVFGVLGIVVLLFISASLGAIVWWWYAGHDRPMLSNITANADLSKIGRDNRDMKERLGPLTEKEPDTSLRKRTMKVADEVSDFLRGRFENHPPYAYPQPNTDPTPSEERKAAIKKCLEYDQETTDIYMRKYKDRMVGIASEYHAKGVRVGFLESSLAQRVPMWATPGSLWEDNPQN